MVAMFNPLWIWVNFIRTEKVTTKPQADDGEWIREIIPEMMALV